MATKRNKSKGISNNCTIRSRVSVELKNRVTTYRQKPEVKRSEGFVVRQAVEEFLNAHEMRRQLAAPVMPQMEPDERR